MGYLIVSVLMSNVAGLCYLSENKLLQFRNQTTKKYILQFSSVQLEINERTKFIRLSRNDLDEGVDVTSVKKHAKLVTDRSSNLIFLPVQL